MPSLRAALGGAALLVLGACVDEPTGPATPTASTPELQSSISAAVAAPPRVSNEIPYREAGYKVGTGRDGDATLTTRALQAMDGTTLLEVTTGTLDSGLEGPQELEKVQVKFLSPDLEEMGTENHGPQELEGAGDAAWTYPALARHSFLQVQANIRTPNTRGRERTGVVTLTERVNLRPDPAVQDLTAPAEVTPGSVVPLSSVVTELNGDVGARYDFVLYRDGLEVDRIEGALVQEGDVVSNEFTVQFTEPGTYLMEVRLENVTPGDWDEANNSALATVVVVETFEPFDRGWAAAIEAHWDRVHNHEGTWRYASGDSHTIDLLETWDQDYQQLSAWAERDQLLAFPITVELGGDLPAITATAAEPTWGGSSAGLDYACDQEWFQRPGANAYGVVVQLCALDYHHTYSDRTSLSGWSVVGRALYVSRGFQEGYNSSGYWYWDLNREEEWLYGGTLVDWSGGVARLSVRAGDATRSLGYDFEIPLSDWSAEWHRVLRWDPGSQWWRWENGAVGDCSDSSNWTTFATSFVSGERCVVEHVVGSGRSGSVAVVR